MKLQSITVNNYRSIENETFLVKEVNHSSTFTLIGINESGKSSFLKAISLIDEGNITYPKDFFNDKKPIEIYLTYKLENDDEKDLKKELLEKGFTKELIQQINIQSVDVCVNFEPTSNSQKQTFDRIHFKKEIFQNYTLVGTAPAKKEKSAEQPQDDFNLSEYFETYLSEYFYKLSHHIAFWKSDNKHLINEQVNLEAFAADPENISIPLLNCFTLAGIDDIAAKINKIRTDPAGINNLQERLSDKVTAHIKKIWVGHQVKIKFQISNMMLSFLVEDEKVKYSSKTTDQRSDGFRQFISFLLTISADSATNQLSNSLLLLDEPETHLHPKAQECLKEELIKISANKENNIVFFATHSNYMIDKEHLDRCFRVFKQNNRRTKIVKIEGVKSTYSEVNFEVFDIPSTDYHNELYGYLEENVPEKLYKLSKTKKWKNTKTGKTEDVSLATYIRHSIHHPENKKNQKYIDSELVESINILRKIKYPSSKGVGSVRANGRVGQVHILESTTSPNPKY